ncbi:MAG: YgjV family protein [Bacilli bacterium]
MNFIYIISQIIATLSFIALILSFFSNKRKTVLILLIIHTVLYGIHYLILGAFIGFIALMIETLRNVVFYFKGKNHKENSFLVLIFFFIIFILTSIFTWDGFIKIIPLIASLIITYGIWQKNLSIYRITSLSCAILYIIYNIINVTYIGMIGEAVIAIFAFIGIIKNDIFKKNKKTI